MMDNEKSILEKIMKEKLNTFTFIYETLKFQKCKT